MSTIRAIKDKNYFHASNEPFNDQALSWGARGLMGYILSKPDGWEVRNYDLYRKSSDGRRKVNGYLAELKVAGYLRRFKIYKPSETGKGRGTIEWVTEIYERKDLNPDNVRCIQNVTVEDLTVKQSPDTNGSDIDITNPVITESVITKKVRVPPPSPIETYRTVANRYPDKATWPIIELTVGSEPDNLAFWEQVIRAYIGCGWNKLNVTAMLDFYRRRVLPSTKPKEQNGRQPSNGTTPATNKDAEAIRKALAKRSRSAQGTGDTAGNAPVR